MLADAHEFQAVGVGQPQHSAVCVRCLLFDGDKPGSDDSREQRYYKLFNLEGKLY